MDDLSSVLREGMFGALQEDNTITDDTATLCGNAQPTASARNKQMTRIDSEESENPLQFGFENIVFEIDNRCDDQKSSKEPIKYCSLAKFVEGNDIARKSFKVFDDKIVSIWVAYFTIFYSDLIRADAMLLVAST